VRAWVAVASAVALSAAPAAASAAMRAGVIDHVADGDTVVLRGGETIRLVQIDTPEVYGDTECYGPKASTATKAMLPRGTHVRVATDPALDQHDRDGRTLAYLWKGASLVNLRLVRDGDAAPYFYRGDEGRYAAQFFSAAVAARSAGRGLWGHCRHGAVPLRPTRGVSTGPVRATRTSSSACNPNYIPCVPNSRSDLNCADIRHKVKVVGSDVYNLDENGDGYGCESYE
jgi:micrococcal nuclease